MTPAVDVLLLGDVNPDLVLRGDVRPRFGQAEQLLTAADLVLGGSGGIMAHALARLGVSVRLIADIGDDVFGRDCVERLRAGGVDVSGLQVSTEPTGLTVVLSDGEERSAFTLVGAIDAPSPGWDTPADVPAARHLHVASFYLQPRRAAALPRILEVARAAGLTTSLDTNLDPSGAFEGLDEVLPLLDWLLPNRAEILGIAASLTGATHKDTHDDLADAAAVVARRGVTVVVKDGDRGALLVHPDGTSLREAGRPITPVDTTGAGDTFDAGFLAAILAGHGEAEALRWACAAGARATQAAGGTGGQPTLHDLRADLAQGVTA